MCFVDEGDDGDVGFGLFPEVAEADGWGWLLLVGFFWFCPVVSSYADCVPPDDFYYGERVFVLEGLLDDVLWVVWFFGHGYRRWRFPHP